MADIVVFLTSGASWEVPSDWDSNNNTIECIGAGAGGSGGSSSNGEGGKGGGGGGYSKKNNLTLTSGASIDYAIGTAGSSAGAGGDTYFDGANVATSSCGAKGGGAPGGDGGIGGAAASGVGDTKYSGGDGGDSTGTRTGGGGGGGAAGLNGDGNNGVSVTTGNGPGGAGGSGDAGSGGSGGTAGSAGGGHGGVGGAGTEYTTHGSGGGGGGGGGIDSGNAGNGATGGNYGAAGAGGGATSGAGSGGTGAVGKAGLIVITYTPLLKLSETLNISESLAKDISTSLLDSISISDFLTRSISLADSQGITESLTKVVVFKLSLSESVPISENLANAFTLRISDNLSISEALESAVGHALTESLSDSIPITDSGVFYLEEKAGVKSEWKFKIKNPSTGKFIANLTNARKRWFVERLNDQTEAGFILDADDSKCDATTLNIGVNELHIYYGDVLKWAGQLVSARKIASGDDIYWEVRAKDWVSLLSKRFCGVESLREFITTDAGVIAWTLIDETQSLANGDFGITEGVIDVSQTRSPTYDKKNILEAIRELSNIGKDGQSNYGFDFEITPLKVFNIHYPYKGTIRNEVVFRYPGNCENFEAFVDSWGIINHEWGLGRHWTGQTAIVSRSDATSQTTYKRREAIKNYRDMSVLAFLQDMVYQDIQWLKDPATVVKFDTRIEDKTGINDYNVGDGVTVVCDKFSIDEWLWIYERRVEIGDSDEVKVRLVVGN
ncbi:MAG: hypothetical protein KAS32_08810 [Candidatus Peribacteraceae bacterium]|nr:hypothetical protein [Candidatus Peribacteraceae bacterium]